MLLKYFCEIKFAPDNIFVAHVFSPHCLNHHLFRRFNAKSGDYKAIELTKFADGWTDTGNQTFLNYIRSHWLVAPFHRSYNAAIPDKDRDFSQVGQSQFVDEVS